MNDRQFTIPGGPEKGKPLTEAKDGTLSYWADRIAGSLDSGDSRDAARDEKLLKAMRAELDRRKNGGKQAAAPATSSAGEAPRTAAPSTAIMARPVDALAGTFSRPEEVMAAMREAAQVAHLVTPQTSCGMLPMGCGIATSVVWIDANVETYGIPHKDSDNRGLDKTALAKISAAAGVDWDPLLTCRLDDGRDPYYVHYRAVGRVRNFDGTLRTEKGEVEIDLRDGAPEAESSTEKDLPIKRKFILRHAESKAMNRVIRRLGVRTNYKKVELDKPFVVARIMFTGQTDDPDLKRLFAEKTFDAFHGARGALYGGGSQHATPALPPPSMQHAAPPVGGSAVRHDDSDDGDGDDGSAQPGALPESTASGAQVVSATPEAAKDATPAVPVTGARSVEQQGEMKL